MSAEPRRDTDPSPAGTSTGFAERGRAGPERAVPPRTNGHGADRSVPDLIRELSTEGADLFQQELELAKVEMTEKLSLFQRNLVSIAVGGAFLIAALLTGLWAVNRGLTIGLAQLVSPEIAVWLSPLILTVALAAIGWGMVSKGKRKIAHEGITPTKTTETLREDTRWARGKVRAIKREMRNHG